MTMTTGSVFGKPSEGLMNYVMMMQELGVLEKHKVSGNIIEEHKANITRVWETLTPAEQSQMRAQFSSKI